MSSIGEKIKEVFTGHSHHESHDASNVKTPDVDAPGAYPTDKSTHHKDSEVLNRPNRANSGHKHTDSGVDIGRPRHDPEVDAKQATSAAGNYPYWGDLPQENENSSTGDSRLGHSHSSHDNPTGIASGAKAIGAGNAHTGHIAPRDDNTLSQTHRTVGMQQHDLPDRSRDTMSSANPTTARDNKNNDHHKGELAAATGAGALGAGYLASHHKHSPKDDSEHNKPINQAGSGNRDRDYPSHAGQSSSSTGPLNSSLAQSVPGGLDRENTRHTGHTGPTLDSTDRHNPATSAHHDNHKRDAALAAGAGAAGLGAGTHLALNRHDDQFLPEDRPTTTYGTGHTPRDSTTGLASDSGIHNRGGIHNTVIGAGSSEHPESHPSHSALHSSSNPGIVGSHSTPATFDEQRYDPHNTGTSTSGHDRDSQGLGAAIGAGTGAGALAAEHKHHHKHDDSAHETGQGRPFANRVDHDDYSRGTSTHPGHSHSQTSQPAQAAAAQAWNKHDQPQHHNDNHSKYAPAAAGAAGVGAAGALAAYYGQGKDHEHSPRSGESERIADRAIGSDGRAQASSGQGYGSGPSEMIAKPGYHGSSVGGSGTHASGMPSSAAAGGMGMGMGSGQGLSSKVVHKCHQCGADNDISNYFNKDATFRMGS